MNHPIKHLFTLLRAAFGAGLLYYVLAVTGGLVAVKQLISTTWLLLWVSTLSIAGAAIEAKRLGFLFHAQGMRLSFIQGYRVVSIGALFNFCIPGGTGGDVMKLYYLAAGNRGRRVEIATLLIVDRAVALCCMLTLVVVLALLDGGLVWNSPLIGGLVATAALFAIVLLVVGAVACSTRLRDSRWYGFLMAKLPFSHYLTRMIDALHVFRKNKTALLKAAGLSFVGHLVLLGLFSAAAKVFIPNAAPLVVSLLSLLGLLANALPITPGGLGVGEAAFEGLFRSIGYAHGSQLILAWRAGMIALCGIGCALYIAGAQHGARISEAPATPTT